MHKWKVQSVILIQYSFLSKSVNCSSRPPSCQFCVLKHTLFVSHLHSQDWGRTPKWLGPINTLLQHYGREGYNLIGYWAQISTTSRQNHELYLQLSQKTHIRNFQRCSCLHKQLCHLECTNASGKKWVTVLMWGGSWRAWRSAETGIGCPLEPTETSEWGEPRVSLMRLQGAVSGFSRSPSCKYGMGARP